MKQLLGLLKQYRTVIAYLFFGVCTTAINMLVYALCYDLLRLPNVVSTILAWLISVLFAFVTNKLYVFSSRSFSRAVLLREFASFFGCRALTGLLDVGIMYVAVDLLCRNANLWKFISNVIVVILNYAASKLLIFRRQSRP